MAWQRVHPCRRRPRRIMFVYLILSCDGRFNILIVLEILHSCYGYIFIILIGGIKLVLAIGPLYPLPLIFISFVLHNTIISNSFFVDMWYSYQNTVDTGYENISSTPNDVLITGFLCTSQGLAVCQNCLGLISAVFRWGAESVL